MEILIAADGSVYTKRMLAYIAAHDEWLGSRHQYTVIHCGPVVPHRAAAFVDRALARRYYEARRRGSACTDPRLLFDATP